MFVNPATGRFWSRNTWVDRYWTPTIERAVAAGLGKRPRIHDMRHTHASWLLTEGVPLLVVSRRLGHESIAVTARVYGHVQPESDDQVRTALARRARP